MDKTYCPHDIEQKWYNTWESAGYFKPQQGHKSQATHYSIAIPPPNVTGSLHMGHAFQDTIMDCLIRYHRMCGDNTLWQPGTDHAGIATQMLVERKTASEEGKSKDDYGRDVFIDKIWQWKAQSGGNIANQLRRLGASADWSRERFTMDEGLSNAVKEAFVRLYEDGHIYRGKRLVNWDPMLKTAISDIEVENRDEQGYLYHVRYPFVDRSIDFQDGYMHIVTTRPETIPADGCLAVHPDDERYRSVIGKRVHVPMTDRTIAIVTDNYPDPEFGTGCVKITPAHDFNDYEVGQRVDIEMINLFNDDASMNDNAPERYRGMDRFEARKAIIADLEHHGFLEKIEPHQLKRPYGDRSGAVIEPYLTDQWYLRASPDLIEPAIDAVSNGDIRFVPKQYENLYFSWLNDIHDWCISRQLWWGHRIPAWYDDDGNCYVGRSEAAVRDRYGLADNVVLAQDDDVLDTWFSSALWTFSALGWPENTAELKAFHPTSTLVTGFDIIFFWVVRMIMFTLYFIRDGNNKPQIPFDTVYVTGLIRDESGVKMSKSKGNVLDPLDMIDGIDIESLVAKRTSNLMNPKAKAQIASTTRKTFPNGIEAHGTDALRFTLAALASTGRDINWDMKRLQGYRNFCNKIWNAARFVLMRTEGYQPQQPVEHSVFDVWINARFDETAVSIQQAIATYRFDQMTQLLYDFIWHDYCDWYLELTKPILTGCDSALVAGAQQTLLSVLEKTMRLVHPVMPFITEEIWQPVKTRLLIGGNSIMVAAYPKGGASFDIESVKATEWVRDVLSAVRKIRSEMNIAPGKEITVLLENTSDEDKALHARFAALLKKLGKLAVFDLLNEQAPASAIALVREMKVHIPLADLIDKTAELARLKKETEKLKVSIDRLTRQLKNKRFVDHAPAHVVNGSREQLAQQQQKVESLQAQYEKITTLS